MPAPTPPQKAQNRYYFDRNYLLQYINQKVKTKVFVDGRFLDVADSSDLEDELHGVGYDNSGNPKFFDYRSIEQVKAGSNLITLDQLQQKKQQATAPSEPEKEEPAEEPEGEEPLTDEEPGDAESEPPSEEEPTEEPEGEEPPPAGKPGKGSLKAHYDPFQIGRNLINESMKKVPKKELHKIVRIREYPYMNITGVITEVNEKTYEIRPLSGRSGRIEIKKENVIFV